MKSMELASRRTTLCPVPQAMDCRDAGASSCTEQTATPLRFRRMYFYVKKNIKRTTTPGCVPTNRPTLRVQL
jgi:hypothetical protein